MLKKGCISLLLMLLTAAPALADVVVIVRREAQPGGNYVRVCDIARVDGPADQAREVAMTVLGPAPVRGETQEISRWDIETRLYEMGVGARVRFSGNDVVRVLGTGAPMRASSENFRPLDSAPGEAFVPERPVTRMERREGERTPAGKPAPVQVEPQDPGRRGDAQGDLNTEGKARVARAIGDYFADQYRAGGAGRLDIEVAASVLSASGGVPASAHGLRVEGAEGKIPGRAKVVLFVRDEADSEERAVTVTADTEVFGLALVAVRNIARGEMMNPEDVKAARVRMEWGKSYLPPKARAVSGREAARALRPGEAVLAEDSVPGMAVKRGQLVIVDTSGKGWRVQTKAKAGGGGAVGDIITVEDMETRKKYPVRITGHGTVSVVVDKNKIIYERP